MIVADSNLIASCVLKSEATTAALALRERDPDWRVPRLWRYEMLNILATMIKTKRLARSDAESTARYQEFLITGVIRKLLLSGKSVSPLRAVEPESCASCP